MINQTILAGAFLSLSLTAAFAQNTSEAFKWTQLGEQKGLQGSFFTLISTDAESVTFQKMNGGLRGQSVELIKANHDFEPIKTLNLTPEKASKKDKPVSSTCIATRNGKTLTIVSGSDFSKRIMSLQMAYQVLDEGFSPIAAPTALKQPAGGVIPVNFVDMSNPLSNNPFQLIKVGNDFLIGYVLSDEAESNLNLGLAKFDADFNIIFNELHEIDMPANRMMDFRLAETDVEGTYYVLIKETTIKNPQTKIETPTMGSNQRDFSRTHINEEKFGVNRIYKFDDKALVKTYQIEGERPTPAVKAISNGTVLVAGLNNDGVKGRYTGAYSITLDADLKELSRAEEKFTEMFTEEMESIKAKEKGLALTVRHTKLLELGERLVLNVELFGSQTTEMKSGNNTSYYYNLLVGDNLLFQMNKDGGFTKKFTSISKKQLEAGAMQYFSGAVVFVKDDVLHCYYNDRSDNLTKPKKERWNTEDYRRSTSVIREVKLDSELNKLSDGAVTEGKDAIRMIAATTRYIDGNLVMFGMDGKTFWGTVVR